MRLAFVTSASKFQVRNNSAETRGETAHFRRLICKGVAFISIRASILVQKNEGQSVPRNSRRDMDSRWKEFAPQSRRGETAAPMPPVNTFLSFLAEFKISRISHTKNEEKIVSIRSEGFTTNRQTHANMPTIFTYQMKITVSSFAFSRKIFGSRPPRNRVAVRESQEGNHFASRSKPVYRQTERASKK